ncbi:GNAT family N-acetyltransferase [Tunturibacter psychrotolerans]|uniref:GNAT family N-acetyltransferase n=1 Tax=Tunturiibacter psychrotolerans TaxID=3069686 RepID=A0AAU7ZLD4_9BACT
MERTNRDLGSLDAGITLQLNNAHAKETSELDLAHLNTILSMACYARGVDQGKTAFLIALDHTAPYQNPNFAWFKRAYQSFVYIDRVIVAESARGHGIARLLYEDLFAAAPRAGIHRIVCEVNLEPPNPASDAFHLAMGFEKVGQAVLYNGAKTVNYFAKNLG